ncbi:MAG: cellulase family glycosylhydrolase [Solirubrobacterales bacterium]
MRRVAALAAVFALVSGATAEAAPTTPLGHSGRWVTDAQGRVVILHGVNMVYKRPPYFPSAAGFDAPDAAFLARHGFNTVRLGLIYAGVEPAPGSYDEAYLDQIASTERLLADHGIFSQLDFHQDLYNERFQGEGWPDWAVLDDGLPAAPQLGFPDNYFAMPGLIRSFDNFWANAAGPGGVGLQDRYAAAYRRVAQRFRDRDHTIGYDLLNEPWPGAAWSTCLSPVGCPAFDAGTLAPFHDRVINQIREVEPQKLIWYEPNVIFNFGADSSHPPTGDPATGFSFHVYCLAADGGFSLFGDRACPEVDEIVFENADRQAEQTGDALLLSEFGATNDLELIRRNVEQAEAHMVSWQYWHYCECDDPTTSGTGVQGVILDPSQPPEGANLRQDKLDVLTRAYPQAVAGTPIAYDFDHATRRFDLSLSTVGPAGASFAPRRGGARVPASTPATEVFVPPRHYPRAYELDVEGGGIASPPGARVARVAACPGRERLSIALRPAGTGAVEGPECVVAGAKRQRLRLKLSPRSAPAGERTCFKAAVRTAGGAALRGARVRVAGARGRTGKRGRARFCASFRKAGRYKATAKKLGFKPARRAIRVRG